jgi:hypothetical protein
LVSRAVRERFRCRVAVALKTSGADSSLALCVS